MLPNFAGGLLLMPVRSMNRVPACAVIPHGLGCVTHATASGTLVQFCVPPVDCMKTRQLFTVVELPQSCLQLPLEQSSGSCEVPTKLPSSKLPLRTSSGPPGNNRRVLINVAMKMTARSNTIKSVTLERLMG